MHLHNEMTRLAAEIAAMESSPTQASTQECRIRSRYCGWPIAFR
jgi:hypothetical protein